MHLLDEASDYSTGCDRSIRLVYVDIRDYHECQPGDGHFCCGSYYNRNPYCFVAIISVVVALLISAIVDAFIDLGPNTARFADKLIQVVVVSYIPRMLYFEFCVKLLMGMDLDRSLREKRSAWSVIDARLEIVCLSHWFHGGVDGVKVKSSGVDVERKKLISKY